MRKPNVARRVKRAILPRVSGISGGTRLVGILGWPVEHSLSPRMQNAAFAALGLDWAYVPLPTPPDRLADALEGLAALGFVGANVTSPHKHAAARLCAPGGRLSVNTLVVTDGGIEGASTDAAILAGLTAERPVVLGDGGAATAFVQALPHARRFSRRAEWPPVIDDADLVVNATSERDEVLVELESAQVLVDLPYPETATAAAARRAGARVVGGLEVLVAQGAASFELWTGLPAPVEAMWAGLGLPP
jgi:shikimate dehydrogenase